MNKVVGFALGVAGGSLIASGLPIAGIFLIIAAIALDVRLKVKPGNRRG